MSELPGDIQVARVKAVAERLFETAHVNGDDGPRIGSDGSCDSEPIVVVHLYWGADELPRRQTLVMQLQTVSAMTDEELSTNLRIAGERAEARSGAKFLRATA